MGCSGGLGFREVKGASQQYSANQIGGSTLGPVDSCFQALQCPGLPGHPRSSQTLQRAPTDSPVDQAVP